MNFRVEVEEPYGCPPRSCSNSSEMELFCIVEETEFDLYSPKVAKTFW
jgi:hypothetical protein